MNSKAETGRMFMEEFKALFLKWNATIQTENHYQGYAECGEDIRITIDIPSIYDADGTTIRAGIELDLGHYWDVEARHVLDGLE
jgi:hypothetical protein